MPKVVIVFGASGGIGAATCKQFEKHEWLVIPTYHKRVIEHLPALQASIEDSISVEQVISKVVSEYNRIDAVVNCAGVLQQKSYMEITYDDFSWMVDVNLRGTFNILQEAMPVMKNQTYGSIVTMASVGGQNGGMLAPHYAAAKAGVISLTKSFARIGAPYVRVNCVSPGLIDTPMVTDEIAATHGGQHIPLGRVGMPQEVAEAIWFVATSTYMTGATINVNGGSYIG